MADETFLNELIAERVAWRQSLTEDDKAKLEIEKQAWTSNETKMPLIAEMLLTFQQADADSNMLLSEAEFGNFWTKHNSNSLGRGVPCPPDYTDEQKPKVYAIYNAKTPGVDGVSLQDFFAVVADLGNKIKAAAGQ